MKKVVSKLRQEVKVDIVTSDDIKIYYTGKFQDFIARYIIKENSKWLYQMGNKSCYAIKHRTFCIFLVCIQQPLLTHSHTTKFWTTPN